MNRPEDSVPEGEIRALLNDDLPHVLSSDQRSRLRARLGLPGQSLAKQVEAPPPRLEEDVRQDAAISAADISVADVTAAPRRTRVSWLAAAAAVVVFGLLVVGIGNRSRDNGEVLVADTVTAPTQTAEPTPEPAGAQLCRDKIGPFLAAIETWDGIDNWAFLTDKRLPEPDLVRLAADAVAAIGQVSAARPADVAEAQMLLSELRAGVATGAGVDGDFAWDATERDAHRAAVMLALNMVTETVRAEGWAIYDGCG